MSSPVLLGLSSTGIQGLAALCKTREYRAFRLSQDWYTILVWSIFRVNHLWDIQDSRLPVLSMNVSISSREWRRLSSIKTTSISPTFVFKNENLWLLFTQISFLVRLSIGFSTFWIVQLPGQGSEYNDESRCETVKILLFCFPEWFVWDEKCNQDLRSPKTAPSTYSARKD